MDYLQKKISEDLKRALNDPDFMAYQKERFDKRQEWKQNHIKEYEKTKKSLKYVFKKEGLVLPTDWDEIYWDWITTADPESELGKIMGASPKDRGVHEIKSIPRDYLVKWAKEYTSRIEEILPDPERPKNNHKQKIRIDYEPKYRFYLLEKLGVIDPKGIFYDTKLSLNTRAELLSKVLAYNSRDCKDLLNGQMKYDEEKKERIDDYLSDLYKNSTQ